MAAALCYGIGGGGSPVCFHVQAGNYDTDTLIVVLGELHTFLGGQQATCCGTACPRTAASGCRRLSPASGTG